MQLSKVRQHAGKPSGQLQRQWVTARPGKINHASISCRVITPQGQGIMESLSSAAGGASAAIERLQRYMQPPPAGFPPGPPGDQSLSLLSDPLACISRLRREYGPLVGLLLGGERVVLVADPAAAKQVLVDQPDVFVKAGTAFFPGSSLTGNGLLVSDGAEWRRQRRLSNPAFRKAAVDRYASAMVSEAQQLLDGPFATAAATNARQQHQPQQRQQQRQPAAASVNSSAGAAATAALPTGVRDVYADFNQLTLNITLAALFSIRSDYDKPSTRSSNRAAVIVAAVEKAFSYFAARGATAMVVPEWVPTPDNVAFREAVQQLDALVYDIIDSRAAAMARQQQQPDSAATDSSSKPPSADLLQSLLESVDDAGQPMSRTSLRDELMTLLVAGQETSAILLGWAAALLAHNPKAQAAAAAEVAAVLGTCSSSSSSSGGAAAAAMPGPGDLPQLPYLTAVVLEALRLWSPAYMVGRCAAKDVQLAGGYTLPAGTTTLVSPYLLHREPTRWKQPLAFRPERWLQLLQQPQQQPQQQRAAEDAQVQEQPGQGSQAVCPLSMQQVTTITPESSGGCPYSSSSSDSFADTSSNSISGGADGGGVSTASPATASPAGYSFTSVLRDLGPNGAYLPFGGGPRNCIGTGFAMTEAVLVLAMLLQRYELQPVSPAAGFPRPKPMLTLRPEAVPLKVVRRQQL